MITYETIRSDFSFVEEFGYSFKANIGGDWSAPSILYSNGISAIEVGYGSIDNKIFVYLHTDGTIRNGIDLLNNVILTKKYKNQYKIAKKTLLEFLNKND